MITIYETRHRYSTEDGRSGWDSLYDAARPAGRVHRTTVIEGPVVAADMGHGVQGGQIEGERGVYKPYDILQFAKRGERGLSIVSESLR